MFIFAHWCHFKLWLVFNVRVWSRSCLFLSDGLMSSCVCLLEAAACWRFACLVSWKAVRVTKMMFHRSVIWVASKDGVRRLCLDCSECIHGCVMCVCDDLHSQMSPPCGQRWSLQLDYFLFFTGMESHQPLSVAHQSRERTTVSTLTQAPWFVLGGKFITFFALFVSFFITSEFRFFWIVPKYECASSLSK